MTTEVPPPGTPLPPGAPLPTPPGRVRRWAAAHPRVIDVVVVVVLVLWHLNLLAGALYRDTGSAFDVAGDPLEVPEGLDGLPDGLDAGGLAALSGAGPGVSVAVIALALIAQAYAVLAWRRSAPVRLFTVVAVTEPALWFVAGALLLSPGWLVALWALAVYRTPRPAWVGVAVAAVLFGAGALVEGAAVAVVALVLITLVMATTAALATNAGSQRRYHEALVGRAVALAAERDRSAELAAAQERTRIAREMHDVVSHSLTVVVTLADGAAAALERSPDAAREAMAQVSETGRAAVEEMRRMLGVLRSDTDTPLTPQPEQLVSLVEQFRELGLPVRLEIVGELPLDPGVRTTVFRLVQEALTNALRHSTGAGSVEVSVQATTDGTRVQVLDDGIAVPRPPGNASGHGLVGMRERVELYGGTLETGPRSGRGWQVEAWLPWQQGVGV